MAHAYTPGLTVAARVHHQCRRMLPIAGEVKVAQGARVRAEDVVAETFMPGDVTPLNLAKLISVSPGDVPGCLGKKKGDRIEAGELLAESKGIFGLFKTRYVAKVSGTIESISSTTGQVMVRGAPLPIQVKAYLSGEVIEVLPQEGVVVAADVTFIQGIFGIGGETFGPIRMACQRPDQELTDEVISDDMRGQVVVGGARVTAEALARAIRVGVSAVVTGGMDDADLKALLGYDLGVAVTGSEEVGLSLILTEGFGSIAMAERTWRLFQTRAGDLAAVNGSTQIRAGVQRPEVVIPVTEDQDPSAGRPEATSGYLEIGSAVRIIRDPYFGSIGAVTALPEEPRALASGSKARVLEVQFGSGQTVVVPRANVELIAD